MGDNKKDSEYRLKIEDFEQLIGALTTFDTTLAASCCQATIGKTETTMFNKWPAGKSDLFTTAMHLEGSDLPDGVECSTAFIPDLKKLLAVMKNVGKYYDIKDSTLFDSSTNGKVKMFVCAKASYIRIASPKYNIKFQLSTNAIMESQLGNIEKVLVPSKYGEVVHKTPNLEDLNPNFLLTANMSAGKFAEISEMMSTLSESTESSIKIQIPEQARIEDDVNPNPLANTLYATISDSQKLVKSSIGNKIAIEFGKMTYAAENYLDMCNTASTTQNFIFLCNKEILDNMSSTCKAFMLASKAKDMEIIISKPNLMHLNMNIVSQTAKSEIYVTVIGIKAAAMF